MSVTNNISFSESIPKKQLEIFKKSLSSNKINISIYDLNQDGVISEKELKNGQLAQLLAQKIDTASKGLGTNEVALKEAMLQLTAENYNIVNEYLKCSGQTYEGKGLQEYIDEETSFDEKKELEAMLEDVKKGKNPTAKIVHKKDNEREEYDINGKLVREYRNHHSINCYEKSYDPKGNVVEYLDRGTWDGRVAHVEHTEYKYNEETGKPLNIIIKKGLQHNGQYEELEIENYNKNGVLIERKVTSHGELTHHQTYNDNGEPLKSIEPSGWGGGVIMTDYVKKTELHIEKDGSKSLTENLKTKSETITFYDKEGKPYLKINYNNERFEYKNNEWIKQ